MVYKKKYSKKRFYKRFKKGSYQRKYYKRRYKKLYRKALKRPEIHIVENSPEFPDVNSVPFDNTTLGVGQFFNLTKITSSNNPSDMDDLKYKINGKEIEGRKIRLKYIYIKGYIKVSASTDADDFNCKLMVFRWKRNTTNQTLYWGDLVNSTNTFDVNSPSTWTEDDRLNMMYKQDWKNDIKINFYKKVKNLYRKYDDANNIIPFKIRIPLYDCVLTCDAYKAAATSLWNANAQPSTNGLYFTLLSNKYDENTRYSMKYKLYYTDY